MEDLIYYTAKRQRQHRDDERRRIEEWMRVIDDLEGNDGKRRVAGRYQSWSYEGDVMGNGYLNFGSDQVRDRCQRESSGPGYRRGVEPVVPGGRSPGKSILKGRGYGDAGEYGRGVSREGARDERRGGDPVRQRRVRFC